MITIISPRLSHAKLHSTDASSDTWRSESEMHCFCFCCISAYSAYIQCIRVWVSRVAQPLKVPSLRFSPSSSSSRCAFSKGFSHPVAASATALLQLHCCEWLGCLHACNSRTPFPAFPSGPGGNGVGEKCAQMGAQICETHSMFCEPPFIVERISGILNVDLNLYFLMIFKLQSKVYKI